MTDEEVKDLRIGNLLGVKAKLVRQRDRRRRYWSGEVFDKPEMVTVVGIRKLSDGYMHDEMGEYGPEGTYYEAERTFWAISVVTSIRTNPFYVHPEDVCGMQT